MRLAVTVFSVGPKMDRLANGGALKMRSTGPWFRAVSQETLLKTILPAPAKWSR
jgi:hypothetical protein